MINDPRIGKKGERRPEVTISGHPVGTAFTTIGIGGGYYVAADIYPSVDVDTVVLELKALVNGHTRKTDKKGSGKRDTVSDVPVSDGADD